MMGTSVRKRERREGDREQIPRTREPRALPAGGRPLRQHRCLVYHGRPPAARPAPGCFLCFPIEPIEELRDCFVAWRAGVAFVVWGPRFFDVVRPAVAEDLACLRADALLTNFLDRMSRHASPPEPWRYPTFPVNARRLLVEL
jgi:hypothetical protein